MAPPRRTTSKESSRSPARSQNRSPSRVTRAFAERLQKARTRTSASVPATSRVDASAAPGRKADEAAGGQPGGCEGHLLRPQLKTLSEHRDQIHHPRSSTKTGAISVQAAQVHRVQLVSQLAIARLRSLTPSRIHGEPPTARTAEVNEGQIAVRGAAGRLHGTAEGEGGVGPHVEGARFLPRGESLRVAAHLAEGSRVIETLRLAIDSNLHPRPAGAPIEATPPDLNLVPSSGAPPFSARTRPPRDHSDSAH